MPDECVEAYMQDKPEIIVNITAHQMVVLQHLTAALQPRSSDDIARTIEADWAVLAGPGLAAHRITETHRRGNRPTTLPYEL